MKTSDAAVSDDVVIEDDDIMQRRNEVKGKRETSVVDEQVEAMSIDLNTTVCR
jgi:hypothetical protein